MEVSCSNFPDGDSLGAELKTIVLGLEFAWIKGIRDLILETNADEVIQLINYGAPSPHHYSLLIQHAREMIVYDWVVNLF